jgi:hypothetical protein
MSFFPFLFSVIILQYSVFLLEDGDKSHILLFWPSFKHYFNKLIIIVIIIIIIIIIIFVVCVCFMFVLFTVLCYLCLYVASFWYWPRGCWLSTLMNKKWAERNWTELNYYVRSAYGRGSQFKSIFCRRPVRNTRQENINIILSSSYI